MIEKKRHIWKKIDLLDDEKNNNISLILFTSWGRVNKAVIVNDPRAEYMNADRMQNESSKQEQQCTKSVL